MQQPARALTVGEVSQRVMDERHASWTELRAELVDRGLSGVRLIIRDEHAGLEAAARKALPEAKQQRCTVHLTRNVMSNVPKRHQKRLGREVVKVLHAGSLDDAKRNLKAFRLQFFGCRTLEGAALRQSPRRS